MCFCALFLQVFFFNCRNIVLHHHKDLRWYVQLHWTKCLVTIVFRRHHNLRALLLHYWWRMVGMASCCGGTSCYCWCLCDLCIINLMQLTHHSGLVVARLSAAREVPGSTRAPDKFLCFPRCDAQVLARAAHLLQCLEQLPPSEPHGWVLIHMAMDECLDYSSLHADSKVKFAAWPTRVGGHLALSDFNTVDPKWTLAYGFAP